MDDSVVGEEPSLSGAADSGRPGTPTTFTEALEKACPVYIMYGMTYRQFWYGPAEMVTAYRKAYELKLKSENELAWLKGAYTYQALCSAAPLYRFSMQNKVEALPYLDKPFELGEKKTAREIELDEKVKDMSEGEANAYNYMKMFARAANAHKAQQARTGQDRSDHAGR